MYETMTLTMLSALILAAAAGATPLVIEPAIDHRDSDLGDVTVDLRPTDLDPEAISAGLDVRHRYPYSRLALVTDLDLGGYLGVHVHAASAGGASLRMKVGKELYELHWGDGPTHQVDETFVMPLPPGERRSEIQVFRGTVVIDRYVVSEDPIDGTRLEGTRFQPRQDTGYRGIWYYNQETGDEYVYKYSGGLGTYCAKHIPFAVHRSEVDKTFFTYGGASAEDGRLTIMASYYDHRAATVPRPTLLMHKGTGDAHDNPVISVDDQGFVWILASNHGPGRPALLFRSTEPYSVEDFQWVRLMNTSYPQLHRPASGGFFLLHTIYHGGRRLHWMSSEDGISWSAQRPIAAIHQGHYQVSSVASDKVASAFNYHPDGLGLNYRTNLYYVQTTDAGETWTSASGEALELPLTEPANPALVRDYESEGLKVYMKDVNFDAHGNPVILYIVSGGWEPGPENGPRTWTVAHWTGREWEFSDITESGNNYDTGSIHVEPDGTWRVIGPTELGPQPYNPGGEVAMWVSRDRGGSWIQVRQVTSDSDYNHTYVRRPVDAHPDFYGFWADGHARQPSDSRLYFCDRQGNAWRLPPTMAPGSAEPQRLSHGGTD
ncbi:MAG: hypothetical protein GF320_04765 [Armatimonadia bacterium]|nr:hypothetical protein [Armatimonadia bacterium]